MKLIWREERRKDTTRGREREIKLKRSKERLETVLLSHLSFLDYTGQPGGRDTDEALMGSRTGNRGQRVKDEV